MTSRLSRQKLAAYCAERLAQSDESCIVMLAAHLIDTKRVGELDLIARDIEEQLLGRGIVIADIHTAETISEQTRKEIANFLQKTYDAQEVYTREHIEPEIIGGIHLQTPDSRLDSTIRTRLATLKVRGL